MYVVSRWIGGHSCAPWRQPPSRASSVDKAARGKATLPFVSPAPKLPAFSRSNVENVSFSSLVKYFLELSGDSSCHSSRCGAAPWAAFPSKRRRKSGEQNGGNRPVRQIGLPNNSQIKSLRNYPQITSLQLSPQKTCVLECGKLFLTVAIFRRHWTGSVLSALLFLARRPERHLADLHSSFLVLPNDFPLGPTQARKILKIR